jgi:hypothetical protein
MAMKSRSKIEASEKKIKLLRTIAIAMAFISTYFFLLKLVFL